MYNQHSLITTQTYSLHIYLDVEGLDREKHH